LIEVPNPSRIYLRKRNNDFFIFGVTTVPEAIESNMDSVYLWKTSSEGSSEPDTHIIESQNHPLHIINDAREGFSANFLFNLPVVAIPPCEHLAAWADCIDLHAPVSTAGCNGMLPLSATSCFH
jgi:hypothetical protein